jgi:hypothetical protein
MPQRINFTKVALEPLIDLHNGDRAVIYDTRQPGLIAELRAGGTLSFYVYRWANGKPHRLRIGAYPALTIDAAKRNENEDWLPSRHGYLAARCRPKASGHVLHHVGTSLRDDLERREARSEAIIGRSPAAGKSDFVIARFFAPPSAEIYWPEFLFWPATSYFTAGPNSQAMVECQRWRRKS